MPSKVKRYARNGIPVIIAPYRSSSYDLCHLCRNIPSHQTLYVEPNDLLVSLFFWGRVWWKGVLQKIHGKKLQSMNGMNAQRHDKLHEQQIDHNVAKMFSYTRLSRFHTKSKPRHVLGMLRWKKNIPHNLQRCVRSVSSFTAEMSSSFLSSLSGAFTGGK